nr:hypothetical protein [Tanacetum cinerariifolium]
VVGRPKSVSLDRAPFRRPEKSRGLPADEAPFVLLAESSMRPEKPKSSNRDHDGSGVVAAGDVAD